MRKRKGGRKMKKKNKLSIINVENIIIFSLVFLLAAGVSAITTNALVKKNPVQQVKRDVLPLENGSEVVIRLAEGKKIIYISYEDLKYISKKRSKMKKFVKNIDGLFARMVE